MELVDAVEVLRLGDQQQLGVAARAHQREALQQVPVGEVLARGRELALVLRAALAVQAPPRGVELQERVLDEAARAHGPIIAPNGALRTISDAAARPRRRIEYESVRIALLSPYSWTYPGGVTRHIEALAARAAQRAGTRRASSRRSTPTTRSRGACTAARARSRARVPRGLRLARAHRRVPANGAVSNMALDPARGPRDAPRAARRRLRRAAHPRAGRAAALLGRALQRRRAAARRHLPHLLRERPHERPRRRTARRRAGG